MRLELHAPHDLSSSVVWSLTSGEELNLVLLVLDLISKFRRECRLGLRLFRSSNLRRTTRRYRFEC